MNRRQYPASTKKLRNFVVKFGIGALLMALILVLSMWIPSFSTLRPIRETDGLANVLFVICIFNPALAIERKTNWRLFTCYSSFGKKMNASSRYYPSNRNILEDPIHHSLKSRLGILKARRHSSKLNFPYLRTSIVIYLHCSRIQTCQYSANRFRVVNTFPLISSLNISSMQGNGYLSALIF